MTLLLVTVVIMALLFAVTNGFHDTAIAVASAVSTRTLTPGVAVTLASFFTSLGSLVGVGVAWTVSTSVVAPPPGELGLKLLLAGLIGAISWNLWTWWRGMPSSSTYALVGGLAGAGLGAGSAVRWADLVANVMIPLLIFPVIAGLVAYLSMVAVVWAAHRQPPESTNRRFRVGQSMAACAVALGHGIQDGQKTVGVLGMALALAHVEGHSFPFWVRVSTALALGGGTMIGGWRIMRTVGRRIVRLDPAKGFVSEASSAGILIVAAGLVGAPVSTTYTVTSSLVGVGMARGWRRVRWRVVLQIILVSLATIPVSGLIGFLCYEVLRLV